MLSNAQKLIAYRDELAAGGMDPEIIGYLVIDAGQQLIGVQGLVTTAAAAPVAAPAAETGDPATTS